MLPRHHDPIVAIATAPGRGAVGMVRVSGKSLADYAQRLLGHALQERQAHYLPFPDAQGQPIDQGIALFFRGPRSFTGEDVLELQAHGGPIVLQLLVGRCLELAAHIDAQGQPLLPGLRIAAAGEFTERAFLNGKLDLAQAEAIADLIDASTEAAARGASQSLRGDFSRLIHGLRDALIRLRMLVEATLDFPEEDIDFLEQADAKGQLQQLTQGLHDILAQARQGALLREGIQVVIAGQPNAGKSSLLNALAGAELAIVTPIAGTTRDKIEQTIQIEGVPLHIVDTAGLRHSNDVVEQMGIARTWEAVAGADAVVFLHDLTQQHAAESVAADAEIASALAQKVGRNVPIIHVWNKSDLIQTRQQRLEGVVLSAKSGDGLSDLRQRLLETAGWQVGATGVSMARQRHVHALRSVEEHLAHAKMHLQATIPALDLLAEELRLAQSSLGSITGEFTSDDLLGVIFSSFCIGK